MKAHNTDPVPYTSARAGSEDAAIIARAFRILAGRVQARDAMSSPDVVRQYLVMRNACEADQHVERFGVMFLDAQNRVIDVETLFTGTLTQTSVYPREVVRACLRVNAASVIFTHNHPSGSPQPSRADETLTQTLKTALTLVDVRVLDHVVVAGHEAVSMAERGLI